MTETTIDPRIQAYAEFSGQDYDSAEIDQDYRDEKQFGDYLVLTDDEADEAASEHILETAWAFTGRFLADAFPGELSPDDIDAMRGDRCEDFNEAALALIDAGIGREEFVSRAIGADGRGHYLDRYDGSEIEQGEFFIYRQN